MALDRSACRTALAISVLRDMLSPPGVGVRWLSFHTQVDLATFPWKLRSMVKECDLRRSNLCAHDRSMCLVRHSCACGSCSITAVMFRPLQQVVVRDLCCTSAPQA